MQTKMKRMFLLLAAAALLGACSSTKEVDEPTEPPTSEAAKRLETLCEQLNSDLTTLYTLIAADELPDCVVNVAPIAPAGETIGYGLAFKQNGAVTLYFDSDATAQKFVPQFGVYEADGARYWAMNGQPLPTATGAPVPVVNEEGIAPRLKAEKGYWHISVDDGKNWWPAGLAPDGSTELATMPLISQVTEETEAWSIVLADGETTLSVPKEGTLHIAVDAEEPLKFQPHEVRTVHYTVTGGSSKTVVTAELEHPDESYTLRVIPTDAARGSIAITAQGLYDKNILIIATDGARTATTSMSVAFKPGIDNPNITVETPGTLAELLAEFNQETITELTVEGNLNSDDIKTLKGLPNLAVLDLESADLEDLPKSAFSEQTTLTAVRLPRILKTINGSAFYKCTGLTSVAIPQGVTSIGNSAFQYCSSLTGALVIPQGVTSIGHNAFQYCSSLTGALVIPQGVTFIGGSAFWGCSGLTGDLVIPQGVTSIIRGAFAHCSGLTGELVIPQNVKDIGELAFYGCTGLTSVTIGNSVKWIENNAFSNCSSLTSITIPDSVTRIESGAFWNCSNLTSIYCKAQTPPTLQGDTFSSKYTLYVPTGCKEAYAAADYWKDAKEIIEMEF